MGMIYRQTNLDLLFDIISNNIYYIRYNIIYKIKLK